MRVGLGLVDHLQLEVAPATGPIVEGRQEERTDDVLGDVGDMHPILLIEVHPHPADQLVGMGNSRLGKRPASSASGAENVKGLPGPSCETQSFALPRWTTYAGSRRCELVPAPQFF